MCTMKFIRFYFLESFFNGCGSAYPGKNGDAGKMEGKLRHSRAVTWSCIELLLPFGEFYSDLFLIVLL